MASMKSANFSHHRLFPGSNTATHTQQQRIPDSKNKKSQSVQNAKASDIQGRFKAASVLKPGWAKTLGGHCECLRNKP